MSTEPLITDQFTLLLRQFNEIAAKEPPIDKVKSQLQKMRQEAADSSEMNVRQKTAIIDRVEHYLNGTYGSTSKEHKYHEHVKGSKNG